MCPSRRYSNGIGGIVKCLGGDGRGGGGGFALSGACLKCLHLGVD